MDTSTDKDNVTVTPNPDEGYVVDEVIVTDENGRPVELTDNGDGTYYYDAVYWAVKNGITVGTNDEGTIFSPDAVCTRAQIVTFLYRCLGE